MRAEEAVETLGQAVREPDSERPTVIAAVGDSSSALAAGIQRLIDDAHEESEHSSTLSGRIVEAGALADIIAFVAQSAWRGELVVEDDAATRSLFFDEGHLVAAESSALEDRLGEVLARRGVLSREQVSACAEITSAGTARFGEAAVKLGFATREVVFGWLAFQIEEIAFAALRIEKGAFAFFRAYEETRLSFRRKLDVEALLERAAQKVGDARRFRSKSAPQTDHPTLKPARLDVLEIVGVYNDAILVLLRELDAMDEGDGVRAELAKFAESGHDRPHFVDAPADDGTVDAQAIASRLDVLDDPHRAADHLARWLYDYASYTLFLARPHLERRENGGKSPRVSQRVVKLLQPIAPSGDPTMPPVAPPPRVTIPAPSGRAGVSGAVPLSATVRMRRMKDVLPGVALSRTVRIAPFSGPAAPPSAGEAVHGPRIPRALAPTIKIKRAREWLPQQARQPALVVAALIVGCAIGWLAHRVAAGAPSAAPAVPAARVPAITPSTPSEGASVPASLAAPAPRAEIVVLCEPTCGILYVDGKQITTCRAV